VRKFEVAENMATTAVELNPCNGLCWLAIGLVALYRDRHEEAIEHFVRVERLNPRDPLQWLFQVAASLAYFFKGDFDSSLHYARLAQMNPLGRVSGDLLEVASLSAKKRYEDASSLLAANPPKQRSWEFVLTRLPFENPARRQELVNYISQVNSTIFPQADHEIGYKAQ
jgi:tetratricopeptide (TPR) repeat protein